jgi:hypothetical protein
MRLPSGGRPSAGGYGSPGACEGIPTPREGMTLGANRPGRCLCLVVALCIGACSSRSGSRSPSATSGSGSINTSTTSFPSPQPTPPPSTTTIAPAVADSCVIGNWRATTVNTFFAVNSTNVPVAGAAGTVLTITADGVAKWDYGAAAPLRGQAGGYAVDTTWRGFETEMLRANAGVWAVTSGDGTHRSATATVNGRVVTVNPEGSYTPVSGSYTCDAHSLVVNKPTRGTDAYSR